MMRIAVTGASGFVGRYVLAELEKHNVEVIAIARPSTKKLLTRANIHWIHMDITQPPADAYEVMGKPDILIHLAWHGLPNYKSLHHFEIEQPLQYAFVKLIVANGLKSLLVTGTCLEYGMQSGPLSVHINTCPVTPYGLAKDTLRKQLVHLQENYLFNLIWARLFYVFGEGQSSTSLFPQLKKSVQLGAEHFNMSGGEQLRDYLPIEQVAKKITLLALKKKNNALINICSGKPQSVRSLVEGWIKENNWNIKLNLGYYPYPDYEPMAFWGVPNSNIGDINEG